MVCLSKASFLINPSPHNSHLIIDYRLSYIIFKTTSYNKILTYKAFHCCEFSNVFERFALQQSVVHNSCIGVVFHAHALGLREWSVCQHLEISQSMSATIEVNQSWSRKMCVKYLALQMINSLMNSLLMLECMGVLFETLRHNRSSLIDL